MANRSFDRIRAAVATCAVVGLISAAALAGQQPQPPPASADRVRTEAQARRAAERLRALQKESEELASRERTLLQELRKLEVDRQIKVEELAAIESELAGTRKRISETTKRAEELKKSAEAQRPDVEARLVQLYKLGRAGYWRLLMDVEDVRSVGRAYRTASAMHAIDRARVLAHQQTLESLGRERKDLETRAKELAGLQQRAVQARSALDRAVAARSALVDSIDARRDLNAQLAGELQAAQQKLQASLKGLDAARPAVLPLRPFQGALPWPARGQVARRFGRQASSRFGTAVLSNGMEISVPEGQTVHPIHEGTVAYAAQFTGYGNLVIVDHGDRAYSLYGYLDGLDVTRGERVDQQTTLGVSGRDPSGTPALYFELRIDGVPVDPLQWLKRP